LGVQLEVGEDGRNLERVIDIFLTRQSALAVVGRGGTLVSLTDQLAVLGFEMVGDPEQLGNRHLDEFRSGSRLKFEFKFLDLRQVGLD